MKSTISLTLVQSCLLTIFVFLTATPIAEAQMKPDIFQHVLKGDSKALSSVLSSGEDVNQQTKVGNTLLMVTAKTGDRKILEVLLSNNADVNVQNDAGATALMIAAKYNNLNVVAELLNHGADPTLTNHNGYTAANFALGYKRYEVYNHLKEAEADFITQS